MEHIERILDKSDRIDKRLEKQGESLACLMILLSLSACMNKSDIGEGRVREDFHDGSYCIQSAPQKREVCYDRFGNITVIKDFPGDKNEHD